MSFRWVPPANGSLTMACSPGPSSPSCSITARTDAGIDPRCTGMCSAWASIAPAASNTAAEQSARSLMLGLNAPSPEHRAHLLGDARQPGDQDAELCGVRARSRPDPDRRSTSEPSGPGSPDPPVGHPDRAVLTD